MVPSEVNAALADGKWIPIPRLARVVPFGYEVDPDDPDMLLPIPLQLEALAKAKKHLKSYSLRAVASWLTEVTGRPISHVGLQKRVEIESTRKIRARAVRNWSARAEKAQAQIKKWEESLGATS